VNHPTYLLPKRSNNNIICAHPAGSFVSLESSARVCSKLYVHSLLVLSSIMTVMIVMMIATD
jgi:hypothetical protein